MPDIKWYISRLRAMSLPEIKWRLDQQKIGKCERAKYQDAIIRIDEQLLYEQFVGTEPDWNKLPLNLANKNYSLEKEISLLGPFEYGKYRKLWHAGFQTENDWPMTFSYDLEYKGRDDIGDARTNWELNRCFQFALLAKDWYASGETCFLEELEELEESWAQENPFLRGIAWTSVMEVAIRCINWMYAAAFLKHSCDKSPEVLAANTSEELLSRMTAGAINMAGYVADHYSRYSSANNHVIIEACCLGLSGIVFDNANWIELADTILDTEFPRQNHEDGVNKEQSLHYQAFFMEAVGLYIAAKKKNGLSISKEWNEYLIKMSCYIQDCNVVPGTYIEFGDNDEGIVLNLCGQKPEIYTYVLQLMGLVLDSTERWADYSEVCETLSWMFEEEDFSKSTQKKLRDNSRSATYPIGGVTIMRSDDRRVVVGIDHGPLGFGSIAAHGHADALSFQYYADGKCVFIDPGTYIYHCDLSMRNEFRKTKNHNTVCIENEDQSIMMGAFLWRRKAECRTVNCEVDNSGGVKLSAEHNGYRPIIHRRVFDFDGYSMLRITDEFVGSKGVTAQYGLLLSPSVSVKQHANTLMVNAEDFTIGVSLCGDASSNFNKESSYYSSAYGCCNKTTRIFDEFKIGKTDFKMSTCFVISFSDKGN